MSLQNPRICIVLTCDFTDVSESFLPTDELVPLQFELSIISDWFFLARVYTASRFLDVYIFGFLFLSFRISVDTISDSPCGWSKSFSSQNYHSKEIL